MAPGVAYIIAPGFQLTAPTNQTVLGPSQAETTFHCLYVLQSAEILPPRTAEYKEKIIGWLEIIGQSLERLLCIAK